MYKRRLPIFLLLTGIILSLSPCTPLGATYVSLETLLKKAKDEKLSLPKPEKDGRYQSLNKRGSAFPSATKLIKDFIAYASTGKKRVLHLDVTFGHTVLSALQHEIHDYVATDSDQRHLAIMAKRAKNLVPPDNLKNLKFFHGNFPADFKHFDTASFDVVLLNRVLHFLTPEQITHTLKELFRILKPGGKVFIIAITPYVKRFESFIPQYKQRLLLKYQYPGYVRSLKHFANPAVTTPKQMAQIHDKPFMFFDAQFMHTILSESGFIVDKSIEFPLEFNSSTWKLDGREFVGAIARKPHTRSSFPRLIP